MTYPTKTAYDKAGTVTARRAVTHVIDVTVNPVRVDPDLDNDAEFVIRVNGRPMTRKTYHQADRLGLIEH